MVRVTNQLYDEYLRKITLAGASLTTLYDEYQSKKIAAENAERDWKAALAQYESLKDDFVGDLLNGCLTDPPAPFDSIG